MAAEGTVWRWCAGRSVYSLRGCERDCVVGWMRHLLRRLLRKELASKIWSPTNSTRRQ